MSDQKPEDTAAQSQVPSAEASSETMPQSSARGKQPTAHESALFPPGSGPNYFGTGDYGSGGWNPEGKVGVGDVNSRGGYGTFTDAGGSGNSALYGEEAPVELSEDQATESDKRDTDDAAT